MSNRLSFSEIIRESYRIFKMQALKIFVLALVVLMPVQIISGFEAQQIAGDASFQELQTTLNAAESQTEIAEIFTQLIDRMYPYVIMDVILALLTDVFSLALAKIVKDEGYNGALNPGYSDGTLIVLYGTENGEGKSGTVSEYIGFGLKMMLKFALTIIVFGIAISLGLMILVIPGIILLFALPLAEAVTAYTGKTGFSAMKLCLATMFRQPALIAYFLGSYIVSYVVSFILSSVIAIIPLGGVPMIIVTAIIGTMVMFALSFVQIIPLVAFLNRVKIEEKAKVNTEEN